MSNTTKMMGSISPRRRSFLSK